MAVATIVYSASPLDKQAAKAIANGLPSRKYVDFGNLKPGAGLIAFGFVVKLVAWFVDFHADASAVSWVIMLAGFGLLVFGSLMSGLFEPNYLKRAEKMIEQGRIVRVPDYLVVGYMDQAREIERVSEVKLPPPAEAFKQHFAKILAAVPIAHAVDADDPLRLASTRAELRAMLQRTGQTIAYKELGALGWHARIDKIDVESHNRNLLRQAAKSLGG